MTPAGRRDNGLAAVVEFCKEIPVPTLFAPILADYIYISGGVIAAVLLILVVIWLLRRS